ncbi:hypothetical protein IW261DRAFT_1417262 [Armillaria novae-zelandiae]|uniref:DDE-1 domain-containing protein n=1 Tax=Armillaria novae-zelandiae TaxID=153914 RepID=A0AA39PGV9_9AGAR|nr:hypothetical protein IW261DRAFT_1417262 [Armillaria novae-zelandiae]
MTTILVEQVNNSWAELCHSVNRMLQAGNGDPHHIQLQMNDLTFMGSSLTVALFISNDPPTHPPLLQPKSKVFYTAAWLTDLFGTHPQMVTRHQQHTGLKGAGQAPFQTVVDANGQEHQIHRPTRPEMSDISNEELDKLLNGIVGHCPGYGRGQIKDALDHLGHHAYYLMVKKSGNFNKSFSCQITFLFWTLSPTIIMSHRHGHKPKQRRDISGLQNQKSHAQSLAKSPEPPSEPQYSPDWPNTDDGMKSHPVSDIDSDADVDVEDVEFTLAPEFLDDEVFLERLLTQAEEAGDNLDDEDWVPLCVRSQRQRRKLEAHTVRGPYKTGPDVTSKSSCTQHRYRTSIAAQTSLDDHAFALKANPQLCCSAIEQSKNKDKLADDEHDDISVEIHSVSDAADVEMDHLGTQSDGSTMSVDGSDPSGSSSTDSAQDIPLIKKDLKQKAKTLTLAQFNQLTIIRNFATLQLKGYGRIATSEEIAWKWHEGEGAHFSCQLPIEKRGGLRASRSLLCDETVKTAAHDWLMAQKIGTVKPMTFRRALNEVILPATGVQPKVPLSERTAHCWLVKLGFRRTVFRKGIYVDGHERPDVVQYRDERFLPDMEGFERLMTKYELCDGVLVAVPPTLAPGEKEILAEFHDESSFHANDHVLLAWLAKGQQKLQKKSRGRLIHVSDFVNEATGRLVVRNEAGEIVEDARKVIYPGSKGDPWWEVEQLLVQVKAAVKIFEKAHPNCQALFVFDNSSSHAALGPDTLHASDMNMSNGGKQRFQKDTIIPDSDSVPAVHMHGKPQKMTMDDGLQKGLKQVLEERGFNVGGL